MPKDVEPSAVYVAGALHVLLPQMTFQVYIRCLAVSGEINIYVFGFLDRDTLIGGYRMPLQVASDLELHLLHASMFFHEWWGAEVPRFYPASVQVLYEGHRAGGNCLRRIG
jgi:hypothetical protein